MRGFLLGALPAHEVDDLATIMEIPVVEGHQNRVQTRERAALVDGEVARIRNSVLDSRIRTERVGERLPFFQVLRVGIHQVGAQLHNRTEHGGIADFSLDTVHIVDCWVRVVALDACLWPRELNFDLGQHCRQPKIFSLSRKKS